MKPKHDRLSPNKKPTPAQFTHEMFGTVRVLKGEEGEVWFVAKDVCDALGFKYASDATKYLDEDEKALMNNPSLTSNPNGQVTLINESGLYSLVLRSRKPEAKKFKKWVTAEVLPSIRKHGAYINSMLCLEYPNEIRYRYHDEWRMRHDDKSQSIQLPTLLYARPDERR